MKVVRNKPKILLLLCNWFTTPSHHEILLNYKIEKQVKKSSKIWHVWVLFRYA